VKTMSEVLASHRLDCVMWLGTGQEYLCICGNRADSQDAHQEEMLTGAGFGDVRAAGAKGWDEAVNEADHRWQIGHASASILRMDNPYRAKETS
jgi:hypothetical protein